MNSQCISRRHALQQFAAGAGSLTLWGASVSAGAEAKPTGDKTPSTVRDRLWVWAHALGSYDNAWGLPGNSRLTPVEGARYLGVPNIILIRYEGKPAPPFEDYAVPFQSLTRVFWSIAGAGGATSQEEREHVFRLAAKQPNIVGLFMDDFFHIDKAQAEASSTYPNFDPQTVLRADAPDPRPAAAALSPEQLRAVRQRLQIGQRRLDLGVTLYTHQLSPRILPHLDLCDVVSLWTWNARDLRDLEANFAKFRQLAPSKRVLLGCYMWDFGTQQPMPLDLMKKQTELGLQWLRAGQVEGLIFLATNICDLKLETVEWTRKWIADVGDQPL